MRMITGLSILLLLVSLPAAADTITADFEGGTNFGNWTFEHWAESLQPAGGNPGGWYFTGSDYWTFAPILKCESGAPGFSGDFAAIGVTRISGDFLTTYCENTWANTFNFTCMLRNDMGTADVEDDIYVYPDPFEFLIPQIGSGWTHYDFDIPSDFVGGPGELPAGWLGGSYMTGTDVFPSDRTFQEVINNVTNIEFWWIHPGFAAIIVPWEAGGDNITIDFVGSPVPTENSTWGDLKAIYR